MRATDAMIEQAELRVLAETEAGVERIRASMPAGPSQLVCDCGEEIPEARRLAVPGTTRCFECACRAEQRLRRCA